MLKFTKFKDNLISIPAKGQVPDSLNLVHCRKKYRVVIEHPCKIVCHTFGWELGQGSWSQKWLYATFVIFGKLTAEYAILFWSRVQIKIPLTHVVSLEFVGRTRILKKSRIEFKNNLTCVTMQLLIEIMSHEGEFTITIFRWDILPSSEMNLLACHFRSVKYKLLICI